MAEDKSRRNGRSGTVPFLPKKNLEGPTAQNMSDEKLAPMTFNMPRDWHTRFKMTAALHNMSMKDLLVESFDLWERLQRQG